MLTATCVPLLQMKGIGKAFSGTRVLNDVQLALYAGEVHILAGENGAGKSTLIKILAGVHTDYEGEIQLRGRKVRFSNPQEAARAGISVIHQELSLIPGMRVVDNIFLGREKGGFGGWVAFGAQRKACQALMNQLGLRIDPNRTVEEYPISAQQTIEIAKALSFEAQIIIMDEPTSALTEPEVERLFRTIEDLKSRGCAIVYISHKMEEIYRIADRITVLRDGQYIGSAAAAELPRAELIKWMVGRAINEQFPRHTPNFGGVRLKVKDFTVADPHGLSRPVVDRVSFEVRAGEIVGLGGLQGSGASELLHGLFGSYGRNAAGAIAIDETRFVPRSPGDSIRRGVALLTNDRKTNGLILGMSITHNVTLASIPAFSPGGWMRNGEERRAAERHRQSLNIKAAGLAQPLQSLSGGNQQKVVLAKWLQTSPKVLLLDEPTRGVDVGAKHEIYELMNRWTQQGYAILLITSEMPELLALSDRILVMHRGRISAELGHEEATQEKVLQAAMGGSQA